MTSENDFSKFYNQELIGLLQPLEQERKKVKTNGIIVIMLIGFAILSFFYFKASENIAAGYTALAFLIAGIILLIINVKKRKKYVAGFKENIVRKIINFIDPLFTYKPGEYINQNDYSDSGLYLEKPDRYSGDDYIEGKRDKTAFCFSELHTQKKVSSGKNTHWVTIFKGLFFIGDFNKNFQSRTFVYSEKKPQLNFFNKLFSSFASGLEKVKLESIEFEQRFIVYSADQVEARYILTPSLMERMVKLEEMMGAGISFSFVKTNIYVAVPIRDNLFEPAIFSKNSYEEIAGYYNTVQTVFEIIDELKLNDRLWNKE